MIGNSSSLALILKATARSRLMQSLDGHRRAPDHAFFGGRMMTEARWNGALIASSDDTVIVEGNHYFPAEAVDVSFLQPSSTTTFCPWKGTAHYHSLHVNGADNRDAAWYYPDPKAKAENIRGRIAFWKGVTVA